MRYLVAVLCAFAFLACSDSTAPEGLPDGIEIVGGNFQLGTVTETLDDSLAVIVTSDGLPVSGLTVCWVAVTEGAGEPFVPCQETDAEGHAETMWTLGTVAGEHTAEARAMLNDTPTVAATYELEALPGPAAGGIVDSDASHTLPDTLRSPESLEDEYGNAIPWRIDASCCAHPLATDSTVPESRDLAADSAGEGEAWALARGDTINRAALVVQDTTMNGQQALWITVDWGAR